MVTPTGCRYVTLEELDLRLRVADTAHKGAISDRNEKIHQLEGRTKHLEKELARKQEDYEAQSSEMEKLRREIQIFACFVTQC